MRDLITQFGIDWKLLLAQVVNFLILLYVLKKFAYGPVLKILKKRQDNIKEGLEASEASKKKLEESKKIEQEILLKAGQEATLIVSKAEDLAKVQAASLIQAAHKKEEQVIASGQKKLEEERLKLGEELRGKAEELMSLGLIKVLGKMSPDDRDKILIQEALQELKVVSH